VIGAAGSKDNIELAKKGISIDEAYSDDKGGLDGEDYLDDEDYSDQEDYPRTTKPVHAATEFKSKKPLRSLFSNVNHASQPHANL
jgi:hypothetical protein